MLKEQIRSNREAMLQVLKSSAPLLGVTKRCSNEVLTVPHGPELRTAVRGARQRSPSWHSISERPSFLANPFPREQVALNRFVDRLALAHQPAAEQKAFSMSKAPSVHHLLAIPTGLTEEDWVQQAASPEERAQRAKALTQTKLDAVWAVQKAQLCVFRPSTRRPTEAAQADVPQEKQDELDQTGTSQGCVSGPDAAAQDEPTSPPVASPERTQ